MHNICNGAIRWQIPDVISDGNSNVYSISHHLRDIRQNNKMEIFDHENEGQGQGQGLEEHDWRIRLEIF